MLTKEAQLIALVSNEMLERADAIICLEGDKNLRTQKALELFENNFAPIIVVSGGVLNDSFNIVGSEMAEYLYEKGVPHEKIIIEGKSQNTLEQAENIMRLAQEKKWKSIILVASVFHQPRAFLTFLKMVKDLKLDIKIFNAPAQHNWFENIGVGNRLELLLKEFEKIEAYHVKGHVASVQEGLDYQQWKEQH